MSSHGEWAVQPSWRKEHWRAWEPKCVEARFTVGGDGLDQSGGACSATQPQGDLTPGSFRQRTQCNATIWPDRTGLNEGPVGEEKRGGANRA